MAPQIRLPRFGDSCLIWPAKSGDLSDRSQIRMSGTTQCNFWLHCGATAVLGTRNGSKMNRAMRKLCLIGLAVFLSMSHGLMVASKAADPDPCVTGLSARAKTGIIQLV